MEKFLDEYESENVHWGGATVILQAGDVAVAPERSATVPVKDNVPGVVGVPDTPPTEFRLKPRGREPVTMAYEV